MCYENGEGTEKNLEKAYYWHQKAAENRDEKTLTSNSYYNEKGKAAENSDEKTLTSNSYYNIEKIISNLIQVFRRGHSTGSVSGTIWASNCKII
ncbi:kinase-like domain-containing protein [Rhizophagus irregularis DAOM 181602=DAOM 197198]|nr:kinase-like domain-containing protein [Rhizophagus irregularis DAOM 181602=DAOM 197198]